MAGTSKLSAAAAVVGLVLVALGLAVPASAAGPSPLTITLTPTTLTAEQLTHPHALGITLSCPDPLVSVTATLTDPDGKVLKLLTNYAVANPSMFFDVSVSPAKAGTWLVAATATGCTDPPPAALTVTGPDVVTNVLTSPTQLPASDYATTGVTFTGSGFHAGVTLDVTSSAPGFSPTTITTDASGTFTFVQTGSAATPDGWYSTAFVGTLDGASGGAFLIGTAPPTTSDPHLTLSTNHLTLSQFLAGGVVASATGYAPGDLVVAFDDSPTGTRYLRGSGPPTGTGTFGVTITGGGLPASERVGVHTVVFQSFLGPDVTATFEVVADPIVTVTANPDPVDRGALVTFSATNLSPGGSYLLLLDESMGATLLLTADPDGTGSVAVVVPDGYTLGGHTGSLYAVGSPQTQVPTVTFTVTDEGSSSSSSSSSTPETIPPLTLDPTATTGGPTTGPTTSGSPTTLTGPTTSGPATVTVTPATTGPAVAAAGDRRAPRSTLPRTGGETQRAAVIGLGLVLAGLGLTTGIRRRPA